MSLYFNGRQRSCGILEQTTVGELSQECVNFITRWENKGVSFSTLISSTQAAGHLSDRRWVFVDCRFVLGRTSEGNQRYLTNHIRGAVYADLGRDLSGPVEAGVSGRHPLPDEAAFSATMSRLGIDSSIQVVAYDESSGAMAAARLWWLLRWAGHESVAVLDGGFAAWQSEGLPTRKGLETVAPRTFIGNFRPELVASGPQVCAMIRNSGIVVDSRTSDRYRGENETVDRVAGHIPTARSIPYPENVDSGGRFLPEEELAARFPELPSESTEDAVFYCGSGVTAAHNILAVVHVRSKFPKLYPGSWSEWINDPSNPIAFGP
ncbi:MAG: sulfurtransferase [Streptosporangiaceae bacterium]